MNLKTGKIQPLKTQLFRDNLEIKYYTHPHADDLSRPFNVKNGTMHWWGQQYILCALVEAQELEESDTTQNAIIEIIDIWHFVLSMFQVMGLDYADLSDLLLLQELGDEYEDLDAVWELSSDESNDPIGDLRSELFRVHCLFPWKHWSKKDEFSHKDVIDAMIDVFWAWVELAKSYDMTPSQLHTVYLKKNEVNINRQVSGTYSEDTKDESDNTSIDVGQA